MLNDPQFRVGDNMTTFRSGDNRQVYASGIVYTTSEIYINIKVEGKGVNLSEKVTIPMILISGNLMCYKYIRRNLNMYM